MKDVKLVSVEDFLLFWEIVDSKMHEYFTFLFEKDPDTQSASRDVWLSTLLPAKPAWKEYRGKVMDTFRGAPKTYEDFKKSIRLKAQANPRIKKKACKSNPVESHGGVAIRQKHTGTIQTIPTDFVPYYQRIGWEVIS